MYPDGEPIVLDKDTIQDWNGLFDHWAWKKVSKTDKEKGAYVLTSDQKSVMEQAGIIPTDGPSERLISISLISSDSGKIQVSYYNSLREGANRSPETRMGREIVPWMEIGDALTIGRIGSDLFLCKLSGSLSRSPTIEEMGRRLANSLSSDELMKRAKLANGQPARRNRLASDFVRNPFVVAGALQRAQGKCEMPNCRRELFERVDLRPYLEVHHIIPLAEAGDDTLANAAALCPTCHRELHHGRLRMEKRAELMQSIIGKFV